MSVLHSDAPDDAGMRRVTFRLPADVQASTVALAGDFNGWSTDHDRLRQQPDGSWELVLPLAPGRYRFRYLVDGSRWENDWYADEYAANEYGGDDSVVVVPGSGSSGGAAASQDGPIAGADGEEVVREAIDYFVDDPDAPRATDVPADLPPPPNA